MSNAQAALQAAATVWAGTAGYGRQRDVLPLAARFEEWLDERDPEVGP